MSTSWTPFTCEQLVTIGQDLGQAIRDDPTLIALFLGQAPSSTPGPVTTPGPSTTPRTNPSHRLPPSSSSCGTTSAPPQVLATMPTPSGSSMPQTAPHTSVASTPTPTPMQTMSVPTVVPSVSSTPGGLMPMEIDVLCYPQAAPAP